MISEDALRMAEQYAHLADGQYLQGNGSSANTAAQISQAFSLLAIANLIDNN